MQVKWVGASTKLLVKAPNITVLPAIRVQQLVKSGVGVELPVVNEHLQFSSIPLAGALTQPQKDMISCVTTCSGRTLVSSDCVLPYFHQQSRITSKPAKEWQPGDKLLEVLDLSPLREVHTHLDLLNLRAASPLENGATTVRIGFERPRYCEIRPELSSFLGLCASSAYINGCLAIDLPRALREKLLRFMCREYGLPSFHKILGFPRWLVKTVKRNPEIILGFHENILENFLRGWYIGDIGVSTHELVVISTYICRLLALSSFQLVSSNWNVLSTSFRPADQPLASRQCVKIIKMKSPTFAVGLEIDLPPSHYFLGGESPFMLG